MKTAKLGAIIKYQGKLCEVLAFTTGKVLFIREIGAQPCQHFGVINEYVEVESSQNFQERSEPVETLEL